MSHDGALFRYHYAPQSEGAFPEDDGGNDDVPMGWRIAERHYFSQNNAKLLCATYHASSNMFVAGFSSGVFGLYQLPDFSMIHTLR